MKETIFLSWMWTWMWTSPTVRRLRSPHFRQEYVVSAVSIELCSTTQNRLQLWVLKRLTLTTRNVVHKRAKFSILGLFVSCSSPVTYKIVKCEIVGCIFFLEWKKKMIFLWYVRFIKFFLFKPNYEIVWRLYWPPMAMLDNGQSVHPADPKYGWSARHTPLWPWLGKHDILKTVSSEKGNRATAKLGFFIRSVPQGRKLVKRFGTLIMAFKMRQEWKTSVLALDNNIVRHRTFWIVL